jgi:hypothetical protein
MARRTKRTDSPRPETDTRVRELAVRPDSSLDAVDRPVDDLDRAVRDRAEAERWAEAAADPAFRDEVACVEGTFDLAAH